MNKHSFTKWLQSEINASKRILLSLYEKYDQLKYIEHQKIVNLYYEHLCQLENKVIIEEVELELIKKKQELIQMKLNRREKIDEAEIDAIIERERQILLGKTTPIEPAQGGGFFCEITEEEESELQKLYHEIIENFHPKLHPEMTQAQRELYDKAQQAYNMKDYNALKVIYDLLCSTQDSGLEFEITFDIQEGVDFEEESVCKTDYTLAEKIFNCFKKTVDVAVLLEERSRYVRLCEDKTEEINEVCSQFPFTIADILKDPMKRDVYKSELNDRLHNAVFERDRYEKEVHSMLESVATHE